MDVEEKGKERRKNMLFGGTTVLLCLICYIVCTGLWVGVSMRFLWGMVGSEGKGKADSLGHVCTDSINNACNHNGNGCDGQNQISIILKIQGL